MLCNQVPDRYHNNHSRYRIIEDKKIKNWYQLGNDVHRIGFSIDDFVIQLILQHINIQLNDSYRIINIWQRNDYSYSIFHALSSRIKYFSIFKTLNFTDWARSPLSLGIYFSVRGLLSDIYITNRYLIRLYKCFAIRYQIGTKSYVVSYHMR